MGLQKVQWLMFYRQTSQIWIRRLRQQQQVVLVVLKSDLVHMQMEDHRTAIHAIHQVFQAIC